MPLFFCDKFINGCTINHGCSNFSQKVFLDYFFNRVRKQGAESRNHPHRATYNGTAEPLHPCQGDSQGKGMDSN